MQRRLDLAASLVGHPKVLFLDEPTTGLDPRSRLGMWAIIRSLVAGGTTLLLTTQYLDEADELADEIVVIDHGLVIAAGTSEQLKDRVGGDVLEFTVPDRTRCSDAVTAISKIGEGEPHVDEETGVVSIGVGSRGSDALIEAVRTLDNAAVETRGLALRRPSLDDVFLALTGHAAEEDGQADGAPPRPPERRRPARWQGHREGRVMSAVAAAPARPSGGPSLVTQARWAVSDSLMIAKRNLLVWMRVPAYLVFTVIQPVMFVLLFVYVFGGAIPVDTPGGYVNFLMPGIIAQTAAFASFATAIALAQETEEGCDRPAPVDADGPFGGAHRPAARRHRPDGGDDPDHRRRGLRGRVPVPERVLAPPWAWSCWPTVFGLAICAVSPPSPGSPSRTRSRSGVRADLARSRSRSSARRSCRSRPCPAGSRCSPPTSRSP